MNAKSEKPKEFTLTILGKDRPSIRQKVFDSKDFILPGSRVGADRREPKSRKDKMLAWVRTPLSERDIEIIGMMRKPNPFHHLVKAIDTSQLTLSIPGKDIKIKVEDFRKEALEASPEGTKIGVAFDSYAKAQYGHSYSDLVDDARKKVITRFNAAFAENLDHDQMNDEYRNDRAIFFHLPVWAPESSIKEYKSLAKQGHVYSQYLAGLLLASSAGGHKAECVDYLLMAYENKHPEAMRVLAEFLHFKNDHYGAMQCALLSVDGGDDYSKKIVSKVLDDCMTQFMQTNHGLVVRSFVIIEDLRKNGFDSILKEHFSSFNSGSRAEPRIPGFMRSASTMSGAPFSEEEKEEFECQGCGCMTSEADFDSGDDELSVQRPRCPDCQSSNRISSALCDCGEPAVHEVECSFLCEDCHENYVSGYMRD